MIRILTVYLCAIVLFAGCSRQTNFVLPTCAKPGSVVTNVATKSWVNLPSSYPIVFVGDEFLTKSEVSYVAEHYHRDVAKRVKDPTRFRKIWAGMRQELPWKIVSDFIARASFSQEAKRLGLIPTSHDLAIAESALSNRYSNLSADYADFCRDYPRKGQLKAIIQQEAVSKLAFDVLFSNSLVVTEHEIDNTLSELKRLQDQSIATNHYLMRTAEAFSVLYNQNHLGDFSFKERPMNFRAEAFEDAPANSFEDEEAFHRVTMSLPRGHMSVPCLTDSTIEMYVITNVSEKVMGRPRLYSGIKIVTKKDLGYEVPKRTRLAAHLRELRNLEIVQPKLQELSRKAGILFPQGFIWDDPSSPYSSKIK